MASMTPIRVRGKKTARTDEKWNTRKTRKQPTSPSISERSASVFSGSSGTKSAKRQKRKQAHDLSRLEQLPTEILQAIFIFSANPDLPIVSSRLLSQLKGRHLHHEITSRVLEKLVLTATPASATVGANATRLMNSRFFTWQFFVDWLEAEKQARNFDCFPTPTSISYHFFYKVELLPPKKLLKPPFTSHKVQFLTVMNWARSTSQKASVPPLYRELAIQAAPQAVTEGSVDMIRELCRFCLNPDTELLRLAVVEGGCKEEMVDELLMGPMCGGLSDIDPLDATIWSWAERARANGNEKGQWLMYRLKRANRRNQAENCS